MTEFHKWYSELQIERTLKALQKNNFKALFVPTASDALREVFAMIPEGATVGVGGSLTLGQAGFFAEAKNHSIILLNPAVPGISPEEGIKIRREILLADYFLSSSNAVTEDGTLYNIDATGNRVGAMMFGPKNVILVCGWNKIVKDVTEAQKRVQESTPEFSPKHPIQEAYRKLAERPTATSTHRTVFLPRSATASRSQPREQYPCPST